MQYYQPSAAPHTVISSSGKHYAPLSRPTSAPAVKTWRPATTASGRASLDISAVSSRHPTNPRYAHIEAKTDTGPNMRKIEERFGITSARYKRTEVFRRIKPSNLAAELRAGNVQDVLVLDLREKDEFDAFHIRDAHNYPASMMSRSMYHFTPEILQFKNKEGKLMVLYDIEEKLAMAVAGNWYEKGIDNFVVMSGGLLALARTHPDLIEGPLPTHFLAPPATAKSHRGATSRPSSAGGFGSTGRAAIGSKSHFATDQNTHANTRPTAGMASCGAPSRSSNPRPVAWNSLRESGPASMGSFYASRSFDSGLASLRVR